MFHFYAGLSCLCKLAQYTVLIESIFVFEQLVLQFISA